MSPSALLTCLHRPAAWRATALTLALGAALNAVFLQSAAAQAGPSEASAALSLLPVAVSVVDGRSVFEDPSLPG